MYADRRLRVLLSIAVLLLGLAGLRSVWFAFAKADSLTSVARGQQDLERVVLAPRGDILDRNGDALAVAEPADDVAISPKVVSEQLTMKPPQRPQQLADLISSELGIPEDEVLKKLTADAGFVYLARNVPDRQVQALRDKAQKHGVSLAALSFEPRNRRSYPNGPMAGQLLGAYGTDDRALSGLELAYDQSLKGVYGKELETRAGSGSALKTVVEQEMTPGKDVQLTLDTRIQAKAEDVLRQVGETYRPKRATAIVMRPDGQLLTMANWPRVDPNHPGDVPPELAKYVGNSATNFTYEPGSTFKALAVASALEDRIVTPTSQFSVPYQIQVADRLIADAHEHGTETMTPGQILAQSSNVGTIKIGQELGAKRFDGWMRQFGFGKPTGLGWPGEEQGLLPALAKYSGSTMGNLPIGQGQLVTPLQIANLYATIANGGMLRAPTMVEKIGGRRVARSAGRRVIRPDVAAQVRSMLKGVFEPGGTASAVKVPGYVLAGKTGTSNVFDTKLGEYAENRNVASVAGFAPADDPKLVIVVVVDEPAGGGYGATVAGPAFGEIARFALQYLRVPPK
ncbi:penicillin-binding protein 2 [Patulibacter brassicae]|uniref:Penicillin-binding protein 2 n=1 Tax=Patulibacter brassicae TaxID=1705717 RepID=A0ABU4VPX1_9ACTN|nr:penicillin-binding protein 2 [Patulibacter brassicae]MDX8153893.1 penicillin-binding protein 2 [Patulibacter brassicae]